MEGIDFTGLLESLGWALADSLWQTGIFWALYIVATSNGKKFSTGTRHNLALAGLFGGSLWFLVTFFISYENVLTGSPVRSMLRDWLYIGDPQALGLELPALVPSLVSAGYLSIVSFQLVRLGCRYYASKRSLYKSLTPPGEQLAAMLGELVNTSGIRKQVALWLSSTVNAPFTMGFLKPVIIMPVALLTHLSPAQAGAILAHELSHIRRGDYLLNLLTTLAGTILFFNPFARLLLKNIHTERENSCDDAVASHGHNRWEYAQALFLVSKHGQASYPFALQAAGKNTPALLGRVQRLMNRNVPAPPIWKPATAFFLCLSVAIFRPPVLVNESVATVPPSPALQLFAVNHPASVPDEEIAVQPAVIDPVEHPEAPGQMHLRARATPPTAPATLAEESSPPPVAELRTPEPTRRIVITTITRFASADQAAVSFTYLQTTAIVPAPANDGSHPYVPSTAFYYPQIDEECPDGPVIVL